MVSASATARRWLATATLALGIGAANPAYGFDLTLGLTTSVDNSGIADYLLARFSAATGLRVRPIVQGTGAILKLAERGDLDAILVHHRRAEDAFVAAGFGALRRDVMASRYLIVGPASDPAAIAGVGDPVAALAGIAAARATFVSRGDDSGTHAMERRLWAAAGIDPLAASGRWYRETGSGMGATLNVARGLGAYTLTESGTWYSFANRSGLVVLIDGQGTLRNPYGVILVNPARHRHVRDATARRFIAWLTGSGGQRAIAAFVIDGERPFMPADATSPGR